LKIHAYLCAKYAQNKVCFTKELAVTDGPQAKGSLKNLTYQLQVVELKRENAALSP